jgi:hypothetical protein
MEYTDNVWYIDCMGNVPRRTGIVLFMLASVIPIYAQNAVSWGVGGGLGFFGADYGRDADPPAIVPFPGFSVNYTFARLFSVEATEDIYFHNYEYNFGMGYAMACNPENRSAFVLGFMTGVQQRLNLPIGENGTGLRVFVGIMADFRIVTLAFGLNHPDDFDGSQNDARVQTEKILEYFWGEGRWLFASAGFGVDFPINDKFLIGIEFRSWLPAYRLWADRELPAIDGFRFSLGFRITPRK